MHRVKSALLSVKSWGLVTTTWNAFIQTQRKQSALNVSEISAKVH